MPDRTPHGLPWMPPANENDRVVPLKKPEPKMTAILDIGLIPMPHVDGGKYVVTLQVYPMAKREDAETVAQLVRDAIGVQAGIVFAPEDAS